MFEVIPTMIDGLKQDDFRVLPILTIGHFEQHKRVYDLDFPGEIQLYLNLHEL